MICIDVRIPLRVGGLKPDSGGDYMDFLIEKTREMLREYQHTGATKEQIREIVDLINASDPDQWFDSIEAYNRIH